MATNADALDLIERATAARRTGAVSQALEFQERAVALLRQSDDLALLAHALRHVGEILNQMGRPLEATPFVDEMLLLYRSVAAPPLDVANAVRSAAVHAAIIGDRDTARRLWTEARGLYAPLTELLEQMSGQPGNPGVAEADARLAELSSA